jgi:spermidine synthase
MPSTTKVLEHCSSPYNTVVVRKRQQRIDFDVEGATFATWHPVRFLTGYSWDAITAGCLLHPGRARSLLLLGLAGGTVIRQLSRGMKELRCTSVEIDPALVMLGQKYMELDPGCTEIIIDDAYLFLARSRRRFDIIIDDVYRTGPDDVERPDIPIADVLGRIHRRLAPGGISIMNFVIGDHHDALYNRARTLFCERFPAVTMIQPPKGYNAILVGGEQLRNSVAIRAGALHFPHTADQRIWQALKARRLKTE